MDQEIAHQVKIAKGVIEFHGKQIIGKRNEVQCVLRNVYFAEYASFFQDLIGDKCSSRYPKDGELMVDLSTPAEAVYLLYNIMLACNDGINLNRAERKSYRSCCVT